MKKFGTMSFKFLYSIKLAIIILSILILSLAFSTFISQGKEKSYYIDHYPVIGSFIYNIGFSNYTKSVMFTVLITLFFINLSLCTIRRVYREITKKIKIKIGPDLIHIGLLLLIIGGSFNIAWEQKGVVLLTVGDEISLGSVSLVLDSFDFYKYDNGLPKDWVSGITIKGHDDQVSNFEIEVNKPLRIKGVSVFQNSYNIVNSVGLRSVNNDKDYELKIGNEFEFMEKQYRLSDVTPGISATFNIEDKMGVNVKKEFFIGDRVGNFDLIRSNEKFYSGLMIKREPGYLLIYISLILLLVGFTITYIQKIGERKE